MPDSPLTVELIAPAEPRASGALVPVSVRVRNVSAAPVTIVGVLDGSEAGARFPRYLPRITGPASFAQSAPEFDMLAPLRLADFRRLAPGEEFDPTARGTAAGYLPLAAFADFRPLAPGRYELRLTLDTASEADERWLGTWGQTDTESVLETLARVPRLRVESNVAVVQVA